MRKYEVLGTTEIYDSEWLTVLEDLVSVEHGTPEHFPYSPPRACAGVIAVTPLDRIVLVRQYRHALGFDVWEFPIGRVDVGEQAQRAAARELVEETGYAVRELRNLPPVVVNPGQAPIWTYMYVGLGAELVDVPHNDPLEEIEVGVFGKDVVNEMISDGMFFTADSVAAWYASGLA